MDNPTRIGLGGTALFTLAGVGAPILTWWVSGPIMAICAAVAAWGFWPIVAQLITSTVRWPFGRIPLHDAARLAYEAAEKANVIELVGFTADPATALNHFKYVFMVDDEADLRGVKPPSTQQRQIPRDELHGQLMPMTDTSDLAFSASSKKAAYASVTVRRSDL